MVKSIMQIIGVFHTCMSRDSYLKKVIFHANEIKNHHEIYADSVVVSEGFRLHDIYFIS